ncbi:DUF5017 domain-containing protein [Sphingobacterium sp. SGG-5]|uniref:DUF5017 domain-containing protein n=1 Tax=Sphingobacterium sp. SGG-5 TaxID=2710881 RepID=UPI0013EA1F42|nr:DUF5017 domain-containing protein [Sphingobacterium sp. SGG-5]NGM63298.1 DUF5017 domain-containing protein [Sphingobacterium sp. SGG-5]
MRNYLSKFLQLTAVIIFLTLNNVYAQKDKTTVSFKTSVQYGKQSNNLSIWVSSDFNGDYTLESIKSATWEDITKKVNFATDKVPVESGEIDVSKNKLVNKPLYIAFKYIGQASARPAQRGWGVSNVVVNNNGKSKTIAIKDFQIINNKDNHEGTTWIKGADTMRFRSNQSVKASESWAIAKIIE